MRRNNKRLVVAALMEDDFTRSESDSYASDGEENGGVAAASSGAQKARDAISNIKPKNIKWDSLELTFSLNRKMHEFRDADGELIDNGFIVFSSENHNLFRTHGTNALDFSRKAKKIAGKHDLVKSVRLRMRTNQAMGVLVRFPTLDLRPNELCMDNKTNCIAVAAVANGDGVIDIPIMENQLSEASQQWLASFRGITMHNLKEPIIDPETGKTLHSVDYDSNSSIPGFEGQKVAGLSVGHPIVQTYYNHSGTDKPLPESVNMGKKVCVMDMDSFNAWHDFTVQLIRDNMYFTNLPDFSLEIAPLGIEQLSRIKTLDEHGGFGDAENVLAIQRQEELAPELKTEYDSLEARVVGHVFIEYLHAKNPHAFDGDDE